MYVTITEDLFKRLAAALNQAAGVCSVHAPTMRDGILSAARDLDDAWNDQNYPDTE